MRQMRSLGLLSLLAMAAACSKTDIKEPTILLTADESEVHYRTQPYIDPGFFIIDDYTCNLNEAVQIDGFVDINKYGTYQITYTVADEAGNESVATRDVAIVLPIEDYYAIEWNAYDTCTSGNYFYTGLIQDCDCGDFKVTVGNISNFGLSAAFNLPISGDYNQLLSLDTAKAGVSFLGTGNMSPAADSIFWNYTISDSISSDVCRSVWIKL